VSVRRAKETREQIREVRPLTVSALSVTIHVPLEIYAGSIRTGALIEAGSTTIALQLDPKDPWDTQHYPREFEEVAPRTYRISGSPNGYFWFTHMQTQGTADYLFLRQFQTSMAAGT